MQLDVQFGTTILAFTVEFRKRKTMEIVIQPPNNIKVVAPKGTPVPLIKEKVQSRGSWIVQKLYEIREIEHQRVEREFVNGESFLYLGRNYSLQMILDPHVKQATVSLYRGKFCVTTSSKQESIIRGAMEDWYRQKTLEKVEERIKYYAHYFPTQPRKVKVKEQQKRWASCTSEGDLLFNWRCSMAPWPVLDYIVVHEMCHLVHFNHSRDFWNLVETILPDYEKRKEWLKKYGVRMDL